VVVQKSAFDTFNLIEPLKIKVSGLSKDSSASIFRGMQCIMTAWRFFGISGNIYTMTQHNISEDLKLQQHYYENIKPCTNVALISVELEWLDESVGLL
jgi:hypothetical protein